eukprot:TRINITY_DN1911_c0_g1_i7.p1 TRINITY_DN1911_c0_g1~~TRINITY_DN1911_c0_g1_i7.p1  ORF type:complete len:513 (+),score=98.35 TRINITY_DN1911_c0_g1_i7:3-1541(+)
MNKILAKIYEEDEVFTKDALEMMNKGKDDNNDNNNDDEIDPLNLNQTITTYKKGEDGIYRPVVTTKVNKKKEKVVEKPDIKIVENSDDDKNNDDDEDGEGQDGAVQKKKSKKKKVKKSHKDIRTFILSATLSKVFNAKTFISNKKVLKKLRKKIRGSRNSKDDDGKDDIEKNVDRIAETNVKLQLLLKRIKFYNKPKLLDLTDDLILPETLKEYKIITSEFDKIIYLYGIFKQKQGERFIVFTNRINDAKKISSQLHLLNIPTVMLHSQLQQRQRLKKLDQFKKKEKLVLICTDVASRGLDIPLVEFVIHYQLPKDLDTYVHRCGRTARIGRQGTSVALVGPPDEKQLSIILKGMNKEAGIPNYPIALKEIEDIREVVQSAKVLESDEYRVIKKQKQKDWFQKAAKDLDLELDDDIQEEIVKIENEVTHKKKIIQYDKTQYAKAINNSINFAKKRKEVFLDPLKLKEYSDMIKNTSNRLQVNKYAKEQTKEPAKKEQNNQTQKYVGKRRRRF